MIQILDLKAQYASIRDEVNAAIGKVLEDTNFILGSQVRELETRIAAFCGTGHAVGVASGTDALRLAFAALNIGPGDEVITTPFTFIATANTISRSGATPVFVDIDPATFNMDVTAVSAAITPRTRAIVPVHLYGQPVDMDPLMEVARRHGLRVIEDCAQSIGARYKGRWTGSFGDIGCFSFFPSKNLGAYGDGGMVVTDDEDLAGRIDMLRRHGGKAKYQAEVVGFNSRLDTLQAAVLNVKLNHLERWNEARRRVAARYDELLAGIPDLTTPLRMKNVDHVYHQYTLRATDRVTLGSFLKERGIATMVYYPTPLHRQKIYSDLGYPLGSLPNSERASAEVISLPMYPELTEEQQQSITHSIRDYYSEGVGPRQIFTKETT